MQTLLEFWILAAFPLGFAAGWFTRPRPRYRAAPPCAPHPRQRMRATPLQFQFTLDGNPTGEMVPEGVDPTAAAQERSRIERRNYAARRV